MKSLIQADARSATHFCYWWAKGFSKHEKGLGLGSFGLSEHTVFMFEAELIRPPGLAGEYHRIGSWDTEAWSQLCDLGPVTGPLWAQHLHL